MSKDKVDTVAVPSIQVGIMHSNIDLPRHLWGGTRAMRAARQRFLPQEPKESGGSYEMRLRRSILFEAFNRTVKNLSSKPFTKPMILADTAPNELFDISTSIDLAGSSLSQFMMKTFQDAMIDGVSYILVDFPTLVPGLTLGEEREIGARPYFCRIPLSRVVGFKTARINGVETLTEFRFQENDTVPDGEFSEKIQKKIRVLRRDSFQVWSLNSKGDWILIEEGQNTLGKIPIVPVYTERVDFMTGRPPLEGLGWLNQAHWQSDSDQRNILRYVRVGMIFASGIDPKDFKGEMELGGNRMIATRNKDAQMAYVEHTGKGVEAGLADLKALEDRMSVEGMDLLTRKPGNETATGKAIDSATAMSPLQAMAIGLEESAEEALGLAAEWMTLGDISEQITVTVFQGFGLSLKDAQDLDLLLKARLAGEISRETFHSELKRRGILPEEFDHAKEVERLKIEGPSLGLLGVIDGGPPDDD